jgi:hypothetical protein
MTMTSMKAIAAAALIGTAALTMSVPAEAGRGYGHGHGGGNAWGAGLVGFGIGALVGSALTPSTVYVAPPPPPAPAYYGPAAYGPPPWSPAWYGYCRNLHGPYFNPNTGYFQAADGGWYFCR